MRTTRIGLAVVMSALGVAATAAATGGGAALVKVEKTPKLGAVIATAQGRTLYLWRADRGRTSACYGRCATYWPPLLSAGRPRAAAGVRTALLGTTRRKDGKLQVTYKGHPVYTFAGDTAARQTNGEGSNGFGAKWYALAPSGSVIDRG